MLAHTILHQGPRATLDTSLARATSTKLLAIQAGKVLIMLSLFKWTNLLSQSHFLLQKAVAMPPGTFPAVLQLPFSGAHELLQHLQRESKQCDERTTSFFS
mmetsp:Transcript_22405/g.43955  ORF Transcript_22405/g.43955 Transcript_22405/m.43955 type:complete len:101 (+) Transcript_22405:115-417(+)